MAHVIDLRGDWAAPPTEAMRRAMAAAEVGDDNSREDPTVNRLEERSAELLGKEAGLFVPSGTMGNLVSVLALAEHGTEVIVGDRAHTFVYEVGGAAAVGGHPFRTLPNDRFGMLDPSAVAAAIRPANIHFPTTGLLLLENTHNLCGGTVLTPEQIAELAEVAHRHGVPVHLDGSRIFNAAAALGLPPSQLAAPVDTATFCLSKGLAAPVGSIVVGGRDAIARARQKRKLLGGGMRQAGVIAAAGIVGLEQMVDRLPEDHANARRLAEGLAELPHLTVDLETVQTNIVFFDVAPPLDGAALAAGLQAEGIRLTAFGPRTLRFVTHYAVTATDVERVLAVTRRLVA
ncbi:MAG TPA: GntG family PLP-dependent aldolase [Thermomicrobiaceae bacterium]|nr:GntG family PLP-dependent aldolase [Thermomicrobiaceae bacterium]